MGEVHLPNIRHCSREPCSCYERNAKRGASLILYTGEKSVLAAGRPAVVTLFARLFLLNGMTNSRTVILIRCHHPINHVFDRYRYQPVAATARGTCRVEGVGDTLSIGNYTTAIDPGTILKLGGGEGQHLQHDVSEQP